MVETTSADMKKTALDGAPVPSKYEGPDKNQITCHLFAQTERTKDPVFIWRLNGMEVPEERAAHWLGVWSGSTAKDIDRDRVLTPAARGALLDEMDRIVKTIPFAELQGATCPTPRMAVYLTLQWVLDPMRKPDPQVFLAAR